MSEEFIRTVRELGQWRGGATPSREIASHWMDGRVPWVSPKDMTEKRIRDTIDRLSPRAAARLTLHSPGDVVVVFRSGILRRAFPVARGVVPFTVNQDLKVLHPDDVDPGYAFHLLRALGPRVINSAVKIGTTVESIDAGIFFKLPVRVPPAPEQRTVAKILDTVDEAIGATQQLIAKLQMVRQGLLHDLLTGGINRSGELRDPQRHPEDFQDTEVGRIPREWRVGRFKELCASSAFGPRFPAELYRGDGEVAVLRTTDMDEEGNIDLATMPRAAVRPGAVAAHVLRRGDLLVSRSGTCGITAVFSDHDVPVIPGAFLIRFRLHQAAYAEFYRRYFNSDLGRPRLEKLAVGGVQKNIKGSELLEMALPVCPPEEADQIVERIEACEAVIDRESRTLAKLSLLERGVSDDLLTGRVRMASMLGSDAA